MRETAEARKAELQKIEFDDFIEFMFDELEFEYWQEKKEYPEEALPEEAKRRLWEEKPVEEERKYKEYRKLSKEDQARRKEGRTREIEKIKEKVSYEAIGYRA